MSLTTHARRALFCVLVTLASSVSGARLARAQGDVIRGRVTGPDTLPIVNAQVSVVGIASRITRPATTDRNGVFTVLFPEAEGDYFVTVGAIGYTPRRYQVKRLGDEDILDAGIRLQKQGALQRLEPVRVTGRPPPNRVDASADLTGNELTALLSSLDLNMMSDPNALALLLPGAIYIPGVDGELGSFSVFGLEPDQNMFLFNGLAIGPDGLPRDAGITGSIAGSPYDATRGGFSGGQVSSRMTAGTNIIRRNLSFQGYTPRMQINDRATQSLGNQPTYASIGGGFSGPIKYNTAYYNIGVQYNDNSRALRTLLDTDELGLVTAGLAPDSVDRLRDAQLGFGLPLTVAAFPERFANRSASLAANLSLSPAIAPFGSYSLTVTGNWGETRPAGSSLYAMPSHAGRSNRFGGSAGLTHQIMIRNAFYSITTLGWSATGNRSHPFLSLPSATVRVTSVLDDESTVVRPVQLGGNPSMASTATNSSAQVSNAVTWMSTGGKHSFRLATQLIRQTTRQDASNNLLGSFSFNSIEDFENGAAYAFTRVLTPRLIFRSQTQLGMAINDQWRPYPDLQVSASLRMDVSAFGSGPERNPLVEQTFGVRNDHAPSPIAFSPRVSFSRFFGTTPQIGAFAGAMRAPRNRISGGVGIFQGIPGASVLAQAVNNTGLPSATQTLSCQGIAAPVPDWNAYLLDPSNVPASCADGTVNTVFSSALPSVTLIDPRYNASRSARGDLTWRGPILGNRFSAAVQAAYAFNRNQSRTVDLNFDPAVRFTLAAEGDRPVFVEPGSISETSGTVAPRAARVSPLFNRVNALRSDLRSDSRMLSVSLVPLAYHPNYSYALTYTLQVNRRQVPGTQSTIGNPLDVEWGLNDLGQTHRVSFTLGTNLRNTVRLSYTVMAASGVPITPRVAGDINGDGYGNDRAFVYDPATTADPELAAAMRTLFETGSPIARRCLARQRGQLAALGACRGPWTFQGANQLGISINPLKIHMPQRTAIQLAVGNPLRGLDILLHGTDRIHGWGRTIAPDQNLLYVRGFDPATRRFRYDVNQRFGSTRPQQSVSIAAPVTFTALVRVDIAPTRERQDLVMMLDRGRTTEGLLTAEGTIRAMYGSGGVPNPIATMVRQADLLRLTEAQGDSLSVLERWFSIRLDSIWTPIARALAALPADYDRDEAYAMYKRGRVASFDVMIRMAPQLKAMLTPTQRRLLPPIVAMQLDENYLETIRASTTGYTTSAAGFPIGGGVPR